MSSPDRKCDAPGAETLPRRPTGDGLAPTGGAGAKGRAQAPYEREPHIRDLPAPLSWGSGRNGHKTPNKDKLSLAG